jgi:DNA-binding GntR family transcriptional regulator
MLADELRKMINNGTLPDGERLVERELASHFSVSRIPMREAIRQLERDGLVEIFRNRGAIVRTLSCDDIDEIYQLRALLEGDAISQSVQNLDMDTLERAELTHKLLANTPDFEKQGLYNHEFHHLLYSGCKNKRLLAMIDELRNQIERYEYLQRQLLANTSKFQDDHASILVACRQRNPDVASREVIKHINAAGKMLKEFIRSHTR